MDKSLLDKFFSGQCTPDEAKKIVIWISTFKSQQDFEAAFKAEWQHLQPVHQMDWEKAMHELNEKIEMEELIKSLPVAASRNRTEHIINSGRSHHPSNRIRPQVMWMAMVAIIIVTGLVLWIFRAEHYTIEQAPAIAQITKFTEKGQKLTLHLEDGSKVILNADSKIMYPEVFSPDSREVILEGEAFFEIAHDSLRPFMVQTGSIQTTVLGTSFNVLAYQAENVYEIALESGSVKIQNDSAGKQEILLEPGEMVSFHTETGVMQKSALDPLQSFAWKDGIIFFEEAGFSEIKSTLERWYGVDIQTTGNAEKEKWAFSGKFENQSLRNILEALMFSHDFTYTLKHKTVHLTF